MKVLIDMPDSFIKEHIENYEPGSLVDIAVRNALKHGIVLDGLTNGEVIQNMFPNAKILYIDEWGYEKAWVNVDFGHGEVLGFSLEWWNRKRGE